jgi:SNF2 family DNA or RNA helicase
LIPGSRQVSGSDETDEKESAFQDFAEGRTRVLVIKPKIGAWGLNWQHCAHMTYFPSHSYEQYYQAVRRCWRFGQKRPVVVDVVATEGGHDVLDNLKRKSSAADAMFSELVRHMNDALAIDKTTKFPKMTEVPSWL